MVPDPPSVWTFAVVAALVTTAGTLAGYFIKDWLLARYMEGLKQRLARATIYKRYKDPIVLAAMELCWRLKEILEEYPTDFLHSSLLRAERAAPNVSPDRDEHFLRHKCESTVYRLASFLGWVELLRQELTFHDARKPRHERDVERILAQIQGDLADGHLLDAVDWPCWRDGLIFRDEQRAVGESLLVQIGNGRTVMGYGAFLATLDSERLLVAAGAPVPSLAAARPMPASLAHWVSVVENFLLDPRSQNDFRPVRYLRLFEHLIELITLLEPNRVAPQLVESAKTLRLAEDATQAELRLRQVDLIENGRTTAAEARIP